MPIRFYPLIQRMRYESCTRKGCQSLFPIFLNRLNAQFHITFTCDSRMRIGDAGQFGTTC